MRNRFKEIALAGGIVTASLFFSSCEKEVFPLYDDEIVTVDFKYNELADSLQAQMYATFQSSNGNYFVQDNSGNSTFHYWRNAHAVDVLVDGYLRTNDQAYVQRLTALVNGIKAQNNNTFLNNFYDDMEWLALSSLRAYDATDNAMFLETTNILWADIQKGISNIAGGGVGWTKDRPYFKNTPANGPAIILAARLARMNNNAQDLATARSLYTWLKATLVDPASFTVWDGINYNNDMVITKNKYTYNPGTFIGAGLELYKSTGEAAYLNDAVRAANAVVSDLELSPGGLMKDEGQGDGGLFKGVLVRYLTLLATDKDVPAADKDKIVRYLKYNAETLYQKGIKRPGLMISPAWNNAPGATTDLSTQLSGMMLIEAAAQLKKAGTI